MLNYRELNHLLGGNNGEINEIYLILKNNLNIIYLIIIIKVIIKIIIIKIIKAIIKIINIILNYYLILILLHLHLQHYPKIIKNYPSYLFL